MILQSTLKSCKNTNKNDEMRKVYYQLSEDCGEDGRAQFVCNFSPSVALQQGTKGSFDTSQELLHIYKNKPLSPSDLLSTS